MVDSHGPIIARAVYDAMFGNPEESEDLSQNGHEVHSEHKCGAPQPDTTTEVGNHIDEAEPKLAAVQIFSGSRLAEVVDTVARKLRESGVSSSHWATFVHVGV